MNVTMEKTGDVSARLTVAVSEADYQEKVVKELKHIGATHALPGFRKGHVPFGELKRRFGLSVTSDIINREVYDAVVNYLRDNKVNVLGEPLPVEVKELDLKNQKDFTFEYDLALSPDVEINVDKSLTIPYYTIAVSDEMINEQDEALRRRFGAQVSGEVTTPDAVIKGVMMQLDANGNINTNEGAIQVTNAIVGPAHFTDKEQAALFADKKVDDKVVFNPWKSCNGNATELASMLNIDKSIAGDVKSDFEFAISEIIVLKPAELGEEFYTSAFGKDAVHNEEEYREAIRKMIANGLVGNSEMLFRHEAQKILLEKFGNMTFADDLMKRWLVNRNDGLTAENIDEEYVKILPQLKWEIISNAIGEKAEIKITEDDVLNFAKAQVAQQFAAYGMANLDDEIITNYAKQQLGDKNFRQRLINQLGDVKFFNALKNFVTVDAKEVSLDEFKAIAEKA